MRPNDINALFKTQSLTLQAKAMKSLTELLEKKEHDSPEEEEMYVEAILEILDGKCLHSSVVTEEIVRDAVGEMERKKEIENVCGKETKEKKKKKKKKKETNENAAFEIPEDDENADGEEKKGGEDEAPMSVDDDEEEEEEEESEEEEEEEEEDRANRERLHSELADEAIVVCDAFTHMPRHQYDETRNVFVKINQPATMDAEADSKINVYRERFHLLRQRMNRHESFTKPAFGKKKKTKNGGGDATNNNMNELTPLRSLVGKCYGPRVVMGCLSQVEDGIFYLEDPTGSMRIDLTAAVATSGMFCENCVVLATGEVRKEDGIFEVSALGHPPAELRRQTLEATNATDFIGAAQGGKHVALRPRDLEELKKTEKKAQDERFVVISDCYLDDSKCLRRLRNIFEVYDQEPKPPGLFVFMGDFTRVPFGPTKYDFASYTKSFDQLADLLEEYPSIREECRFVFVPGPGDPGNTSAYPRPGLPAALRGHKITACLQKVEFVSNPCKIRWHSQDLVFFRDDLQARARRGCLLPPVDDLGTEEDDERLQLDMSPNEVERRKAMREKPLFHHLALTLVQQSHLSPLPLTQMPIYWERDQAMWLYPAPNAIFLGDRSETQCQVTNVCGVGTSMVNPGCFADDGSFAIYNPSKGEVDLSVVSAAEM